MTDRTDWDKRAATYDTLGWVHNPDLLDWTAEIAIEAIRGAVDHTGLRRVLEVGCGTGALTALLASERGVEIDAVDVSPAMLERCSQRLPDAIRDNVYLRPVTPGGPLPDGPFAAVVSRMVLHHAFATPEATVAEWVRAVPSGGAIVIAEGPPPSTDDRHEANHLYRAAMALKEPGRHVFHAHDVAEWLFAAGCAQVQVTERWSEGNSVRGWLSGGGIEPGRAEAILALHREASPAAKALYRIEETADGDLVMRWRHSVVVGVRG
jgi:SAM-dependent methyltransferase